MFTCAFFVLPVPPGDPPPACGVFLQGCMIPFGMRLLHAKLPLLRNDPKASQDRLYELLDFCQVVLVPGPRVPRPRPRLPSPGLRQPRAHGGRVRPATRGYESAVPVATPVRLGNRRGLEQPSRLTRRSCCCFVSVLTPREPPVAGTCPGRGGLGRLGVL